MNDKQRADALAAVIHDLKWIVTTDHESKNSFIERVKKVLGADPALLESQLHKDIYKAECRISQLEQELAAAKKECLEAKQDQARYLKLIETGNFCPSDYSCLWGLRMNGNCNQAHTKEELDAPIDKAIAAMKESK